MDLLLTLAQADSVGVFEDINIKNKSIAVWEILLMLLGAYLLGYLTYWLIHQFTHGDREERELSVADAAPAVAAAPIRRGASMTPDDLTMVEGIGPKINELLQDAGINTFQELADAPVSRIRDVLDDAGPRFRTHDPASWPKQAQLAADGEFEALEELQDKLDGGR